MDKKRFTIYYYNDCMVEDNLTGEDFLIDQYRQTDAVKLRDLLNDLHDRNMEFENALKDAIMSERTSMGRSVLLQLADSLGIEP